jgi:hypothetical protein
VSVLPTPRTAGKIHTSILTAQLGHLTCWTEYMGSSRYPGNNSNRGNEHFPGKVPSEKLETPSLTPKLPQRSITSPVQTDLKLAYQSPLCISHKSHASHPQVGTLPLSYCNITILLQNPSAHRNLKVSGPDYFRHSDPPSFSDDLPAPPHSILWDKM